MNAKKPLYRITFISQGKVYEIYAHSVGSAGIFGFIEIGEFSFGERSGIVLDPSEDRIRNEFAGVKRTFIPMHSVIRIDEVDKRGTARIRKAEQGDSVTPFPMPAPHPHRGRESDG